MAPHVAPFKASLGSDYDLLLVWADRPPAGEARAYAQRLGEDAALNLAVAADLFESYAIAGTPHRGPGGGLISPC